MSKEMSDWHRTTVYLGKQHENLLDYIILTTKRDHGLRLTKSDVIRKGIEAIARMKADERLDVLG